MTQHDLLAGGAGQEGLLIKYTVIIEEGPTSNGAYIPDLPGCVAAGKTRAEAIEPITEGVVYHLELMAEHGETIPQPTYSAIEVEVQLPVRAGGSG